MNLVVSSVDEMVVMMVDLWGWWLVGRMVVSKGSQLDGWTAVEKAMWKVCMRAAQSAGWMADTMAGIEVGVSDFPTVDKTEVTLAGKLVLMMELLWVQ